MRDDPYRSLAAFVRRKGGYMSSRTPHAEFLWANFFRTRISAPLLEEDFDKAVGLAVELARTEEAKDLPGYLPAGDTAPEPAPADE